MLQAELDAIYAKLYGLTKDELEYILTTFPVLKKNETRQFGEFRTGRLVLEAWERMKGMYNNLQIQMKCITAYDFNISVYLGFDHGTS